ncbi:MAG TPA: helix-turn-helix transcriptional regulator [Streptosporangiaceae bacterium]|jgi:transcriptional regulator with XRE-family HTH domain|nr:helix-turn-helix transcriptional regulator [Streptosporangiaceae bacterium]
MVESDRLRARLFPVAGQEGEMSAAAGRGPHSGVLATRRTGPILPRLVLGEMLRRLREAQGISAGAAGEAIRASESKINRLELGRVGVKLRDVADLCTLYGVVDHAERTTLLELARQTNLPAWWQRYRDVVPTWFETYLGLEQDADVIRGYEVQFVPGLLQTAAYARAVIELSHGSDGEEKIERRLTVRMRRQQILHRPGPPRVWMVIDEAALRRPIGGRATMFAQLEHLIDICELPHVTIQVLPFRVGGHAAGGGPISVLRLPAPELPDVVYLEQLATAVYPDKPSELEYYRHIMNRLAVQAEPASAAPEVLRQILSTI